MASARIKAKLKKAAECSALNVHTQGKHSNALLMMGKSIDLAHVQAYFGL